MSFSLNRTINAGKGLLFGSGGKPTNTYAAPNIDFLREAAPSVDYSFLRNSPDLTKGFRGSTYYYNPANDVSGQRFNTYTQAIAAPTSADQVRGELEREQLTSTLGDIEKDTQQRFGRGIYDYFNRGLFDPSSGADSSVAQLGLSNIAAEGARTAANARTTLGLADIERQAAREAALREAYGQRYSAGESQDAATRGYAANDAARYSDLYSQGANLASNRELAYAQGLSSNIDREMQRKIALANALNGQASASANATQPGNYGLFGTFANSYASGLGKKLSGG